MTVALDLINTQGTNLNQGSNLLSSFQAGQGGFNFLSLILSGQNGGALNKASLFEQITAAQETLAAQAVQAGEQGEDDAAAVFNPLFQPVLDGGPIREDALLAGAGSGQNGLQAFGVGQLYLIDGKLFVSSSNGATGLSGNGNNFANIGSLLGTNNSLTENGIAAANGLGPQVQIVQNEQGQFILVPTEEGLQTSLLSDIEGVLSGQAGLNAQLSEEGVYEWRLSQINQGNGNNGLQNTFVAQLLANRQNTPSALNPGNPNATLSLNQGLQGSELSLPFDSALSLDDIAISSEQFEELIVRGNESSFSQQALFKPLSSHFTSQIVLSRGPGYVHPAVQQVSLQIAHGANNLPDTIHLQLKPESLGHVKIELEVQQNGQVRAVIAAESPETLDLLRHDAKTLTKALNDAGLETGENSLEFNLQQGNSFSQDQRDNQNNGRANLDPFFTDKTENELETTLLVSAEDILTPTQVNIVI